MIDLLLVTSTLRKRPISMGSCEGAEGASKGAAVAAGRARLTRREAAVPTNAAAAGHHNRFSIMQIYTWQIIFWLSHTNLKEGLGEGA